MRVDTSHTIWLTEHDWRLAKTEGGLDIKLPSPSQDVKIKVENDGEPEEKF